MVPGKQGNASNAGKLGNADIAGRLGTNSFLR